MTTLLDDYVAGLPSGLASYPDVQQKASLYRNNLERNHARLRLDRLPAPIANLIREPVPVSGYISAALAHGYYLGVRTLAYPDDASFLADVRAGARNILDGPIYRILMRMVSPQLLVRGASKRWNALQRGMTLEMESLQNHTAILVLRAPKPLLPLLMLRYYATAMTVTLELSGAKSANVTPLAQTENEARFQLDWT